MTWDATKIFRNKRIFIWIISDELKLIIKVTQLIAKGKKALKFSGEDIIQLCY